MNRYSVDPAIERASTLPRAYYVDAEAYDHGRDAYFANSWQFVGDTNLVRVPGEVHPFTLLPGCLDEPLVLTRDMQDRIHCLSNVCTHRGMILCDGSGNERFLRCRYHGRRFGLDGSFQHMPEFEKAENFPTAEDDLSKIPLAIWKNMIFTSLSPVAPFEQVFAPVLERVGWLPLNEFKYDAAGSRDYLVRTHWALYCDNYLEEFHIPFIHAGLHELLDYEKYSVHLFEHGVLQLAEAKGAEDVFDLPADSPDFGKQISAYYFWIFPNLMLNFYPWGLSINVVRPLGIDTTKVSFIWYVWDESKMGRGAGGALDRVEREDEEVVERVMQGMRSRHYTKGRFSPTKERGTHHFHRMLADRLGSR